MEEGEERGLAERAAMAIKARVGRSLAGGDGALNVAVSENGLFALPFIYINKRFAKTGSGQT